MAELLLVANQELQAAADLAVFLVALALVEALGVVASVEPEVVVLEAVHVVEVGASLIDHTVVVIEVAVAEEEAERCQPLTLLNL